MSQDGAMPIAFIGSSTKALPIVEEVRNCLSDVALIHTWNSAFDPGRMTLQVILDQARRSDFGVFIIAPDDEMTIKGESLATVRDNVLFESGVFMGALGADRTFLLIASSMTHEPSEREYVVPSSRSRTAEKLVVNVECGLTLARTVRVIHSERHGL